MKTPFKNILKPLSTFTFIIAVCLLAPTASMAQRSAGMVGIGGQFGEPSGLSLKFYNPRAASADFLASWDFNQYVFIDGHAIFERHLGREGTAHFFFGPGGFLAFRDRSGDQNDDVEAGISGRVGLGVMLDRFEIYGHLTPRLQVTPSTDGKLGGGVGIRYYF